jgi:hypothetical protein
MAAGKGFTNDVVAIDSVHEWIHKGLMFSSHYYDNAVADDGVIELLIQVPAGQSAHLRVHCSAGGDAEMRLFEAPTFSSAGTALAEINRNRVSSKTAQVTVTHTPTTSDDGTEIEFEFIPGGGAILSGGGDNSFFNEIILAPGEDYLVRLTNVSGGSSPLSIGLHWYEPA